MAPTMPQFRISEELDKQLQEIATSYNITKSHFARTVLQIAVRTGVFRDWLGNKDGAEAANHDRHYLSIVLWLRTHGHGATKFAEIIGVSEETGHKMWQRYCPDAANIPVRYMDSRDLANIHSNNVIYGPIDPGESRGNKVDD